MDSTLRANNVVARELTYYVFANHLGPSLLGDGGDGVNVIVIVNSAWKFWIPAACANFWLVPLKKQVVFMSACSIVWTGYLSYASNLAPAETEEDGRKK